MRRIKFITLFLAMATMLTTVYGQTTSIYSKTGQIKGSGYTYQCDNPNGYVKLYNVTNKFTYVDWALRDGSNPYTDVLVDFPPLFEDDNWTAPKAWKIVKDAFSASQKQLLSGEMFFINMKADPDSGKVIEVEFRFVTETPFMQIPLSVYRSIELSLKKEIWFIPNATGKKLNYLTIGWMQTIE